MLVIGPAGSGKSTFCSTIQNHCDTIGRSMHVANLDPAADEFRYSVSFDIRDLISLSDAMEEMGLGPNGALLFCMEHLVENAEWFEEQVGDYNDDFLLLDCPGQIELYSHSTVIQQVGDMLRRAGYQVGCVYLMDSQFISDPSKFIAGSVGCLSSMIRLEMPHVSFLTKCDLLGSRRGLARFTHFDPTDLVSGLSKSTPPRFKALNEAMAALLDEYSLVQYLAINKEDPESVIQALTHIEFSLGFGEDEEVKTKDHDTGLDDDGNDADDRFD